jgi:nitroreductase
MALSGKERAMEFGELVKKRRIVRNFSPDPVDPATIDRIVALARHAPSAGFTQGQSFVVVTRPELKGAIAELCGESSYVAMGYHNWISGAPVLIIPCTSEAAYHRRYQQPDKIGADGQEINWPVPYWHMDVGCAVMVLLLAVVDEGLAAGFAGAHDLEALKALLKIPAEVTPVGVIPVGHPLPDKRSTSLQRGRKPDALYVHREQWAGEQQ